jgi:protein-disulfide isomerase
VPVLEQVLEQYSGNVKVVYKNYPLKSHKYARQAAIAVIAADRQGKFWAFHDLLFKNYKQLSDQKIRDISVILGMDTERFQNDLKDPQIQEIINQEISEAARLGVNSTPTVFINGKRLRDRRLQGFQAQIEKELRKAGHRLSGTTEN